METTQQAPMTGETPTQDPVFKNVEIRGLGGLNQETEDGPELREQLSDMFDYHPWTTEQAQAGMWVRRALIEAAAVIIANVPPGPDRSVAIRKLREARMDANSAITHNGRY